MLEIARGEKNLNNYIKFSLLQILSCIFHLYEKFLQQIAIPVYIVVVSCNLLVLEWCKLGGDIFFIILVNPVGRGTHT